MAKTLTQRYEELNAEIERLNRLSEELEKKSEKIHRQYYRWRTASDRICEEMGNCDDAIRQVIAQREEIMGRLMKGKGEKWLPPEKAPVAYFEEDAR